MKRIELKSIANGEIILKEDIIEFNDKSSRMNKWLFKIYPFLFLIFGIYQIYYGIITEGEIQIFGRIISGILLLLLLLLSIPSMTYHSNFIRTNRKKVTINEILEIKMKKIFGEILIDFKLKDDSTRRVYNIKNMNDWTIIRSYLIARKINCLN